MDFLEPLFYEFGPLAGVWAVILFFVWLIVSALVIWFALWIQYTIIWKAVRRGMREFHYGGKLAPQAIQQTAPQPVEPPAP